MDITYKVEKLKSGGYKAYCPLMEPVIVFGNTVDEASEKLLIAARVYVKRHPEFVESIKSSSIEV